MARQRGRHSPSRRHGRKGKGQHWFVAYKEMAPETMAIRVVGPLARDEVAPTIEQMFMNPALNCDGAYEWAGEPDVQAIQRSIEAGKGIGIFPEAVRLILHPRHEAEVKAKVAAVGKPDLLTEGTAEEIRDSMGLKGGREN